jgi:Acyl-coenzyme A:6-aminopenicillanic acid acyl-transferase
MIHILKARNEFAYGYAAGKGRESLYRKVIRTACLAQTRRGIAHDELVDRARRHAALLRDSYPACYENLSGLSRALGLSIEEVTAGSLGLPALGSVACTNFAAVPPATSDDKIFVSWNLDLTPIFRLLMGRMPLYIRDIEGSQPYVCMGFPALFGIGIMNGQGLCSAVNSVGAMDGGEGLTFFELNNLAMETCSTVEEALAVWRDNPREVVPGLAAAILLNANSIFADMGGNAVVIEHSHNHMAVATAEDRGGIIASANHHQFLDRKLSGGADPFIEPIIAGSFARLARMWELLETFKGNIDRRKAKMINSDHGLNYSTLSEFGIERGEHEERIDDATICCHPWNFFRHLKRFEVEDAMIEMNVARTLNSMFMDPKSCTVWITQGNPCRKQYLPVWLGDALKMEWADRARQEIEYEPGILPTSYSRRKGPLKRPNATPDSERIRSIALSFFKGLDKLLSKGVVAEGD